MSDEEKIEQNDVEDVSADSEEVSIEEAESATGIKDEASNQEAVDRLQEEDDGEFESIPSFFIEDDDRIRIDIDILFDKKTGEIVSVSRSGALNPDEIKILGYSKEFFEFTPVPYEQMSNYRQRCNVYRRDANRTLVDPIALRNFLIVRHLKDWSMRDRKGKKIELEHNDEGILSESSIKSVYKMNTTLLDVVLTLFEKDMMM